MKTFPAIVTGIFILLAIGSIVIFATFTTSSHSAIGAVSVWGAAPRAVVVDELQRLGENNQEYSGVTYRQVPEAELVADLVEAIASGTGPDLVVLPQRFLLGQADKLQVIPYSSFGKRAFQDSFIQSGESFLGADGAYGLPFTVDPLVMYWNRALFAGAGLANPPRFWDDVSGVAPKLSRADKNGTLTESAVSLGTWTNVDHAKAIIVSILGELGNPIVALSDKGAYQSVLAAGSASAATPFVSALRFYADFGDPTKPVYSWNSSMPHSHDAFTAGKLAVYFGYASELSGIRAANPNLDFDVAPLPAIRGGGDGGFANIAALAVPRGARNPSGALALAETLTSADSSANISAALGLPSVRRDAPAGNGSDPYAAVFRNAALRSFAFPDPDPAATDGVFKQAVEDVVSGKRQSSEAAETADQSLQALLGAQ